MKATTGSSLATTSGSSSSATTSVGSNGGRRNGRTTSRSVLLKIETDQQQQQLLQPQQQDRRRSNRRSPNEEETLVNSESVDDRVDSSVDDELGESGSQNNNNKDEEDSNCDRATNVGKIDVLTSTPDKEECCTDVGNVDEKVDTVEGLNELQLQDETFGGLRAPSSELNLNGASKSTAGNDDDSIATSNFADSDEADVPLVIDDKRLSYSSGEEDMDLEKPDAEVNMPCNMDAAESEAPILHSESIDEQLNSMATTDEVKYASNLETLNAEAGAISGLSHPSPVGVCATSVGESLTHLADESTVLEVVDESGCLKTESSTSAHDQPAIVDEPTPDAADIEPPEPEVTVLDIASSSSPVVVIEPEAPDDVSSTGRAADGSVDGDDDDDEDDDEDQRNDDSNAGSPTDSSSANVFSMPLVSRSGVRPAQVIEVVCGNQRARLDVRLLVAGLIRASNNTTSRAPCVLVEASAVATLAATADGDTNAERTDEVAENLSGSCSSVSGMTGSRVLTLTPNQFQKYSGRGTARDWKRSTRHHGASLKSLISRRILVLDPDSYGCYCNRCIGDSGLSGLEGPEDLTGQRATSPKSNDSTSVDQENLPPSCDVDDLESLSSDGRAPAAAGSRSTTQLNHGLVGPTRKRPSITGFGGCVDDGSGLPSSKRRKGSGSSLQTQMSADDQELMAIGGSWIKSSSGSSKEEKMANIIRELRNYKNNLSEKIDANRRHSSGNSSATSPPLVSGPSSPVASSYPVAGPHSIGLPSSLYVDCDASSPVNFVKSIDTVVRPDSGLLHPFAGRDLNTLSSSSLSVGGIQQLLAPSVRPSKPSGARRSGGGVAGGSSRQPARRRSQLQYKTDEHGALDLSATSTKVVASQGRSRTVSNKAAKSISPASVEADGVLDLRVGKPAAVIDKATKGQCSGVVRAGDGGGGIAAVSWPPLASLFSAPNLQKMLLWSVNDVVEFASRVPGCNVYAETLRKFGIDGSSLALLSVDQMTNILGMRVDVAKALRNAVDRAVSSPPIPVASNPLLPPSSSAAAFGLPGVFGGSPLV